MHPIANNSRPSPKIPKKVILISAIVLFAVIGGGLFVTHHYQLWPFLPAPTQPSTTTQQIDYSPPSSDQVTAGASTKETTVDNSISTSTDQNTSSQPINVSFTSVQPGQTVSIRTLIDLVSGNASCVLRMQGPGGKEYTATASTQAYASSSTCQGFNVPMSSLASGTWTITVTVTDGGRSGSATTEKVL